MPEDTSRTLSSAFLLPNAAHAGAPTRPAAVLSLATVDDLQNVYRALLPERLALGLGRAFVRALAAFFFAACPFW